MADTKQAPVHATTAQQADRPAAIVHPGVFHKWGAPPLLTATSRVALAIRVSNLVIGNLRITVRDEQHRDLYSAGYGEGVPPLSTQHEDIAWEFMPSALERPRYVIWNIWADYANGNEVDEERSFEVEVTLRQDDMAWIAKIALVMPRGQTSLQVTLPSDYVAIGAPL